MSVLVGHTRVAVGEPVYVIAEIGSNHNGSLETAFRLIQAAADAGADAAKFQLYRAEKLYPGYVTEGAIPDWWLPNLKAACHEAGIGFLCSVFCRETLDAYMRVAPAAVKIASPEATDAELLSAAADTGLPVLVSTGAMSMGQVDTLMRLLRGFEVVLLHCVSAYPALLEHMNLAVLPLMAHRYGIPVGLSDHSLDPVIAPVAAAALGACVIEKHLTLDRNQPGPDHAFALEPGEFTRMVDALREFPAVLGDGVKRVMPSEDAHDRRVAA